ncbi:amino acid ABC transporter substrate-binding protein, partial [Pseudomonas syringae]|nr:amino acid ABC transporter substrate-binding protein [Pseudomonas syringae]
IRNNPVLPVGRMLRALLQMRLSGEIQQIIDHYTTPTTP